jgi:hypothetical protein
MYRDKKNPELDRVSNQIRQQTIPKKTRSLVYNGDIFEGLS